MLTVLLSYLLLYKYTALFLFVLSVSIIVPLPINPLLLATGAFASFGYFDLWISVAVTVVASVLGDTIDYFIGRYYGPWILEKLNIKKRYYFERFEHGIRTNAGATIFVTRFVGQLDQLGSFFAGSIDIPVKKFLLYDFLGNFASAVLVLVIGYLAGNYWQNFSGLIDIIGAILLVALLLFWIIRVFLRRHQNPKVDGI